MNKQKLIETYESNFPEGSIIDGVIDPEKYLASKPRIA